MRIRYETPKAVEKTMGNENGPLPQTLPSKMTNWKMPKRGRRCIPPRGAGAGAVAELIPRVAAGGEPCGRRGGSAIAAPTT